MNTKINNTYFSSLDFLKAFAMFAVITNHIPLPVFNIYYSIYSVTLFILVAGMTSVISVNKTNFQYSAYLKKKFLPLLGWYLVALIAHILIEQHFFSFTFFLKELRSFGLEVSNGHLYFLAFYIELMLVAPFIVKLYLCKNANIIKNLVLLLLSWLLSLLFYRYTCIEGLALGSRYAFGGSYFFVLNLGIFFWIHIKKLLTQTTSNVIGLITSVLLFIYFYHKKYIDLSWSNPPNQFAIFYTLIIFSFLFCLHNLLVTLFNKIHLPAKTIFSPILIVGKNSLYIYFFHMIIVDIINKCRLSHTVFNKLLANICCLYLPILLIYSIKKIASKLQLHLS